MEKLDKIKEIKEQGNLSSVPTDMHSDGVHFDKNVLISKRNESARSADESSNVTKKLDANSETVDDQNEDSDVSNNTSKKKIIKDMEGGYNRNAPINDNDKD